MNNGRHDRALLLAILAALGGLYWQVFSMNEGLARVETHLEHIVPCPSGSASGQSPSG